MKKLVLMKGLQSSGKSYRAKELAGETGVILSTDEFFYKIVHPKNPEEYSWNPLYLEQAHKWNLLRCQRFVHEEHPLIIIDNTNIKLADAFPYASYAYYQDYDISVEEPTSDWWKEISLCLQSRDFPSLMEWAKFLHEKSEQSGHNVPLFSIERNIRRLLSASWTLEDLIQKIQVDKL